MKALTEILIAFLGSATVANLIIFFVQRKDKKKEDERKIPEKLETLEKDGLRTQLLVLITLIPDSAQEILTIAEHYFKVLHGDWYMTSIFNKWLTERGIAEPEWFDKDK